MSVQRAVVNCKRCYVLAQSVRNTTNVVNGTYKLSVAQSDSLYVAKNEAMRALEEERNCFTKKSADFTLFTSFLLDCMDCSYSTPTIADKYTRIRK